MLWIFSGQLIKTFIQMYLSDFCASTIIVTPRGHVLQFV